MLKLFSPLAAILTTTCQYVCKLNIKMEQWNMGTSETLSMFTNTKILTRYLNHGDIACSNKYLCTPLEHLEQCSRYSWTQTCKSVNLHTFLMRTCHTCHPQSQSSSNHLLPHQACTCCTGHNSPEKRSESHHSKTCRLDTEDVLCTLYP